MEAAAFELFEQQGFERTTVAEIALAAGLTPRTFFNHFTDKREVLFGLSTEFQRQIVHHIASSAETVSALDAVLAALQAANETIFEGRRPTVVRRRKIMEANPELHERELSKWATLTDKIAEALLAQGHPEETALLAASAGMLVQQTAIRKWTQPAEIRPLRHMLTESLEALRTTVESSDPSSSAAKSDCPTAREHVVHP